MELERVAWGGQLPSKKLLIQDDPDARVARPSHGYFTTLRFALPFLHRKARHILQDLYSQELAKYPAAEFHAAAHSNGTYILAQALKHIEAMKFNRIMLGGCVLPRGFDWHTLALKEQVKTLRHELTATDGIVGILCSALAGIGRDDVGTAGYNGFTSCEECLFENQLPNGGHSAAFNSEKDHEAIARFLTDVDQSSHGSDSIPPTRPIPQIMSNLAQWLWVVLLAATLGCGLCGLLFGGPVFGVLAAFLFIGSVAFFLHIL